jgi:uncharacterized protein YdbL (DUF1318 family)
MKMLMTTPPSFLAALLSCALLPCLAPAASREDELKESFKQRFPDIAALKEAGTVGETHEGYLALVNEKSKDEDTKELVEQENEDRKELYKLIADQENTTPAQVARRAGKRAFEKARPGEYLKGVNGKWRKKE